MAHLRQRSLWGMTHRLGSRQGSTRAPWARGRALRRRIAALAVALVLLLQGPTGSAFAGPQEVEGAAAPQVETAAESAVQANVDPVLVRMREELDVLERRLVEVRDNRARAQEDRDRLATEYEALLVTFRTTRQRLEIAGLTGTVGPLLRRERAKLPSTGALRALERDLRTRSSAARLLELDLAEEQAELRDPVGYAAARLALWDTPEEARDPLLLQQARELAREKLRTLEATQAELGREVELLLEAEAYERDRRELVLSYRDYIDERVLWIASARPIWRGWWPDQRGDVPQITGLFGALFWAGSASNWWDASVTLLRDMRANPEKAGVSGLLVLLLFFGVRPAVRRLVAEGKEARRRSSLAIAPTLRALLWTALAAAPLPALFVLLGWRLDRAGPADGFELALGHALTSIASTLFAVQFLRRLCHPEGLGARHFEWPEGPLKRVRRELFLLASIAVPAEAAHAFFQAQGVTAWYDTAGRWALLLHLGALALFFLRILTSRRAGAEELSEERTGMLAKLTSLWLLLGVGTPCALGLLALGGYLFTASELLHPLQLTILLFVLLTLSEGVAMRWVRLAQRRLWMARMRERREAARRAREAEGASPEEGAPLVDEPPMDLDRISGDTTQLLHAAVALLALFGVFFVWAPSIPALGLLSERGLYSVERLERSDDGGTRSVLVDVTVANLAGAAFLLLILAMAFRRVPALLEITLLQRLQLGAGERNAVVTLTKYCIVIAGVVMLSGALGISWSKLQWLVAAISVGLGFGLQEIFGNFVSGLILLFERPIRVGDIVTIGGVDGRVTKMRIRATTITDWDRRELIVPNKEFVTGRLINWTLSDPITRLRLNVGIAYGSDTAKARELLLEVANTSEHVMKDPPPRAAFLGFGDNSLDFTLFAFLPTRDVFLDTMQDLHFRIDQAFRKAGIEIAFPQRDLHLVSAPALEHLVREWRSSQTAGAKDDKPGN